ncbi:MAG: tRNA lysidine(34) synthetase TilS [Psychroflexus sp.]|nr:tRNA lysidine(34) synthetase TilS [Psychroflexus sp.]MDN6310367.1 tRNA lysidine(34) synthetase TilS [Psychroflexus sp.]
MLSEFQTHLSDNFPELERSSFLIACSGGVDSMVLTDLCLRHKLNFGLVHCNFQLRDVEAEVEENFVKSYAQEKELSIYTQTFDTHAYAQDEKLSIQEAARELRYGWFEELLGQTNYKYILTAHHLNDSIETFMINLFRGTGLAGLTGIPAKNKKTLRPLLIFSRSQIETYAKERKIEWKEDVTNASTKYVRNAIRHEITPVLEKQNPHLYASFLKTFTHLNAAQNILEDYIAQVQTEVCTFRDDRLLISIEKLKSYPHYEELLYHLLKDKSFNAWEDLINLMDGETGKFKKSTTHLIVKDREHLICEPLRNSEESEDFYQIGSLSDRVCFEKGKISLREANFNTGMNGNYAFINPKKLIFPLFLRRVKNADRFMPLGMTSHKKVLDFLKDRKVPTLSKKQQWVLTDKKNIIWVVGHQIDENYKVLNTNQKCIEIVLVGA